MGDERKENTRIFIKISPNLFQELALVRLPVTSQWARWRLQSPALLNRLFKRRSKKTSKLRVTVISLCDRWPVNSPHKGPVTRQMFPFDDVIMYGKSCVANLRLLAIMHELNYIVYGTAMSRWPFNFTDYVIWSWIMCPSCVVRSH